MRLSITISLVTRAVHEANHHTRRDFIRLDSAMVDLDAAHEIVIALHQLNVDKLEGILHDVSDPSSPRYGHHLTREEVGRLTYNGAALEAVRNYLNLHAIIDYKETLYGEYITARASRRTWESLFSAKFHPYKHSSSGDIVFRSSSYTLPPTVEKHIFAIYRILELPRLSRSHRSAVTAQAAASKTATAYITPALLNSYYNIFTNKGNTLTSQTIYSTVGQYFSSSDLAKFQSNFGIPTHPVDHDPNARDNPAVCNTNALDCAESNLDLQYITAVAQDTPTTIMTV